MSENKIVKNDWTLDHFFDLLEIYDKMKLDIDPKELKDMDKDTLQNYFVLKAVPKLPKVRKDVYKLIASLTELTEKEVSKKGISFIISFFTELMQSLNFQESLAEVFTQEPTA